MFQTAGSSVRLIGSKVKAAADKRSQPKRRRTSSNKKRDANHLLTSGPQYRSAFYDYHDLISDAAFPVLIVF